LSKIRGKALLLALLSVLGGEVLRAQTRHDDSAGPRLKLVVILARHGVRSSTWTQERLDSYSALLWPKWNVPPGNLTKRGHELMREFGEFDRASFAAKGLLAAKGCADVAAAYIWADTDQRTIESGQALAEGLFPGCPVMLHGLPEGRNDPLFHPAANGVKPAEADAAFAEMKARVDRHVEEQQQALLIDQVSHVLMGCAPQGVCKPVRRPEMTLPEAATAAVHGKGDHMVDLQGPLPMASTFAEDFLLEFADGMPMADVGWGKVDEAELGRLLALHSDYFELMHRTPAIAKIEASNMLFHIARTLEQGAVQKPVDGAVGPVGSKVVFLAGHDTNLAALASLLGVHWKLDGRDDDTPPGMEMAFELWQDATGAYSVRVSVAMQTLRQLRDMPALTMAAPPARETLSLPGCPASGDACGWAEFKRIVDAAIDTGDVFPMKTQ
jgi:4-phytase / acid phosphatase